MRNDFSGWHFGSGFLYSPEGDRFTSGDVRSLKPLRHLVKELELSQASKKQVSKETPSNVIQFPFSREAAKIA